MCARFTLRTPTTILAKLFEIAWEGDFVPRSDIRPSQSIHIVRCQDSRRELASVRWQFLPLWAKSPNIENPPINAKAETVATNGMFKLVFRRRRCLVPVDAWYEWKAINKKDKERYLFRVPQQPCFAFAGIWDRWESKGDEVPKVAIESCAIVTTEANDLVAAIHDKRRMPVILRPKEYGLWLDHTIDDPSSLLPLLRPFPNEEMEAIPVPRMLGNDWFDARCWPHLTT